MGQFATLKTAGNLNASLASLLEQMLRQQVVHAVLIPAGQPGKGHTVMQTLIADPQQLDAIDPFAPVVTANAAKLVASLTYRPAGRPLAVVLRSCEVRAFLELVKLRQGSVDDLLIVGLDCLGRYENRDYQRFADQDGDTTLLFLQSSTNGGGTRSALGFDVTEACQSCKHPVADNVDLRLGVLGADPAEQIWLEALTDRGVEALGALGYESSAETPPGRAEAIHALVERRRQHRAELLAGFTEQTADLAGLQQAVQSCVNCYNCRVACPVCYCRECVFGTDTFRHEGEQYLAWADRKGRVKLPTDTVFYHLTRMVHMSALCVGCGQCSSACPNDVPVMELLSSMAERTQRRFDYVPGRSLEEGQPLAVFQAEEFGEVTGQVK